MLKYGFVISVVAFCSNIAPIARCSISWNKVQISLLEIFSILHSNANAFGYCSICFFADLRNVSPCSPDIVKCGHYIAQSSKRRTSSPTIKSVVHICIKELKDFFVFVSFCWLGFHQLLPILYHCIGHTIICLTNYTVFLMYLTCLSDVS